MRKRITALCMAMAFAVSMITTPFAATAEEVAKDAKEETKVETKAEVKTDAKTATKDATATVTIECKWLDETGRNAYKGATPSVSYEVYEGTYESGEKPVLVKYASSTASPITFTMKDNDKTYTIVESFGSDKKGFKEAPAQTIDLAKTAAPKLVFSHIYVGEVLTPASLNLDAEVSLDDKNPANGTFGFALSDSTGKTLQLKYNVAGKVAFDAISIDKVGTYTYTVSEQRGTDTNITYDDSVYRITATATKKDGKIVLDTNVKKDGKTHTGDIVFDNTYKSKPDTLSATVTNNWYKEDGKTDFAGQIPTVRYDVYEGKVETGEKPIASYPMPVGQFSLNLTVPNDGQSYTVREVFTTNVDGFTPDGDQVIDTEKGTGLNPTFNHTYKPKTAKPATVNLKAIVSFDGKTPENGKFGFVLSDATTGAVVQTKTNVAKNVTFDALSFDKEGTYSYTMSEQVGSDATITYDSTVYAITVAVAKGADGALKATTTMMANGKAFVGKPVFINLTKTSADKVNVIVTKVWKNDTQSTRPSSVTAQLYRNGVAFGAAVTLSSSNNWKYTWTDLDKSYTWTVKEAAVPSGYTSKVTNSGNSWTITNTKSSDTTNPTNTTTTKTSVSVTKVWKNDKESARPSSVSVQLYRNGSVYGSAVRLTEAKNWKYTWSNLDSSYSWTVNETAVPSGYTKSVTNSGNSWTITNTAKAGSAVATTSTPTTGDDRDTKTWMTISALLFGAMLCFGAALYTNRRRMKGKK